MVLSVVLFVFDLFVYVVWCMCRVAAVGVWCGWFVLFRLIVISRFSFILHVLIVSFGWCFLLFGCGLVLLFWLLVLLRLFWFTNWLGLPTLLAFRCLLFGVCFIAVYLRFVFVLQCALFECLGNGRLLWIH